MQADRCAVAIDDIISCSTNDVVVVQVPNIAVARPIIAERSEVSTAMCMDSAFRSGLTMDAIPAEINKIPNMVGNRAVR